MHGDGLRHTEVAPPPDLELDSFVLSTEEMAAKVEAAMLRWGLIDADAMERR